ncbi:MAG TPA: glycosyltransferase, partial [Candidatus Wunengus sp. YC61]|uniref:glycosyltransferase n=1 Tax=Candidatus Wunengus sp. YC61 TaxID=3367698 RepID=UPI0040286BAE
AYKQADLFLFPSKIECSPIVLFEAMASKTPFLTTDVGNAQEIIKWSGSGMILPTSKDKYGYSLAETDKSAALLEKIYNNPIKLKTMAENGYKAWKKRFTWSKIARQYEQIYKRLTENDT